MTDETQTAYRYSQTLGDIMQARALQIDIRRQEPNSYQPIPTHIPALNKLIDGGIPVEDPAYIVVLSPEKLGKTTVGMDLADSWRAGLIQRLGEKDGKVLYVQLEELGKQYADRTFAKMTSLSRGDLRMFNITEDQMKEIYDAANLISQTGDNLLIQDDLFSIYGIIEEAKRIGCKNIVLDNLQLLDQQGFTGSSAQERFAAISRHLVKLRNQEGYSFIVISQMGAEGRAFGSGQANRDADLLIQLEYVYEQVNEEDNEEQVVEGLRCLHVLPSRIAREGRCQVAFDGSKSKISSVATVDINSHEFLQILEKEGPSVVMM